MKLVINISLKDGVLDPEGQAIETSLSNLGFNYFQNVRIGKQIILNIDKLDKADAIQTADQMCQKVLANTVIENYEIEILEDN
jgi:phosphoribosylformylglycinamidine synthase PurS subunit